MNDVSGTSRTGGSVSDLAQLRRRVLDDVAKWRQPKVPQQILDAAQKYLALKEAGALIITPDENEWLRIAINAAAEADTVGHPLTEEVLRALHVGIRAVLDALRDAMPDGDT